MNHVNALEKATELLGSDDPEKRLEGLQILEEIQKVAPVMLNKLEAAMVIALVKPLLKQIQNKMGSDADFFFDNDDQVSN